MDKIVWQLGADSSQVRAEMANAVRSGQQGASDIARSFDRVDVGHEKVLKGSAKVSKQISHVAKDMLSGASATDIFAASLEGIGKSLKVSLGALTTVFVGAVIAQKVAAVREEYHKLQEEIKAVHGEASKSGDFKTLSTIETQSKRAEAAVKKLQDAIEAREGKKGIVSQVGQFFSDAGNNLLSAMPGGTGAFAAEQARKDRADRGQIFGDQDTLAAQEMTKRRQQSGLKEAELSGSPESAIKAAQVLISSEEKVAKTLDEFAQNIRETSIALQGILKVRNDKAAERAGMNLKEIAAMEPDVVNNSVTFERYQASQQAKKAVALDEQGEAARKNFQPELAHDLFSQAGEAKESITNLKPSEKMAADFKGALAQTEAELAQIAKNTAKPFVNR